MRGDELQAGALRTKLVNGSRVQIARQEQLRECDREQAPELFDVCPLVFRRRGQERGQAADAVEGGALGRGEDCRDCRRRARSASLELREPWAVGRLVAPAIVE